MKKVKTYVIVPASIILSVLVVMVARQHPNWRVTLTQTITNQTLVSPSSSPYGRDPTDLDNLPALPASPAYTTGVAVASSSSQTPPSDSDAIANSVPNSSTSTESSTDVKAAVYPPAERCVLYDRPPRTGSTTISGALTTCLRRKGYWSTQTMTPGGRDWAVRHMLNSTKARRASVQAHIVLSLSDLELIGRTCAQFLYVTSAAPMVDRLLSRVKYLMFDGHGNQTIDAAALLASMARRGVDDMRNYETFLEHYPYDHNDSAVTEERRFTPHIVIHRSTLRKQTRKLLKTLGCDDIPLHSDNVHKIVGNEEDEEEEDEMESATDSSSTSVAPEEAFGAVRSNISSMMQHGDFRFEQLVKIAERENRRGTRLAAAF